MISYIKGTLAGMQMDVVVLENHGIGYEIRVPLTVCEELPKLGSEVKLFTYLYVREDILQLYGFLRTEDLEVFKLLLTVSGIGPKAALGILSSITPDDLRFAILSEDKKTISKAPGIGAKTAQRVVLELNDKPKLEDAFAPKEALVKNPALELEKGVRQEALLALTSLGYSATEATSVLSGIEITPESDVEEILKLALKNMAFI